MANVDGVYYEIGGRGPETVTFLSDVGMGPWQWAWQQPALAGPFRTVVPTQRGCGQSGGLPADGPDPPADLQAVWRDADIEKTQIVAAGLSGRLALTAAARSGRVDRIAVLGTPRRAEAFDTEAVCGESRLVTQSFRDAQPEAAAQIRSWRATEDASRPACEQIEAALAALDPDPLYEVTTETLVVQGTADQVCPPSSAAALAEELPRGTLYAVPEAGHLVGCEAPRPVTDRLFEFFGNPVE